MIFPQIKNYFFQHKTHKKFKKQFSEFHTLCNNTSPRFKLDWKNRFLCLRDNTTKIKFDHHYIYHTAWAIRKLKAINPAIHVDISSILYFSTIASAFYPIQFYDYRPAEVYLDNLTTGAANLTKLKFENNSIESLSCMHTIEHIGLGRYTDALDPEGDLKAISELKRVLKPNGSLLLVIPIGKPIICFNAHRIYAYKQIIEYFSDFQLIEFSLIPDNPDTGILYNASAAIADQQNFGCGCFWFVKKG